MKKNISVKVDEAKKSGYLFSSRYSDIAAYRKWCREENHMPVFMWMNRKWGGVYIDGDHAGRDEGHLTEESQKTVVEAVHVIFESGPKSCSRKANICYGGGAWVTMSGFSVDDCHSLAQLLVSLPWVPKYPRGKFAAWTD